MTARAPLLLAEAYEFAIGALGILMIPMLFPITTWAVMKKGITYSGFHCRRAAVASLVHVAE